MALVNTYLPNQQWLGRQDVSSLKQRSWTSLDVQEREGLVLNERGLWVQGISFVPGDEVANARHVVIAYDGLPGHILGCNQLDLELAGLRIFEVGADLC